MSLRDLLIDKDVSKLSVYGEALNRSAYFKEDPIVEEIDTSSVKIKKIITKKGKTLHVLDERYILLGLVIDLECEEFLK